MSSAGHGILREGCSILLTTLGRPAGLQRPLEPAGEFQKSQTAAMLKKACARLIQQLPVRANGIERTHQNGPKQQRFYFDGRARRGALQRQSGGPGRV